MIGVNLTGVWKSAKAVAPHMIERQSGSIVITSSTNGLEAGLNYAHYVAAKHGVIGLMKNIALELAPYGIRCNSIKPGAIKTPMTDHQGAWDMFAGHPGGTEQDMMEGGYHFARAQGHHVHGPAGHRRYRALPQLQPGRQGDRRDDPGRRRAPHPHAVQRDADPIGPAQRAVGTGAGRFRSGAG